GESGVGQGGAADAGQTPAEREGQGGAADRAGRLSVKTRFPAGGEGVLDSVQLSAEGRAPREPQDERQASYDPLLSDVHATIEWSRPQAEVHNLIRGCDPQPGAHTTWRGARLRLFEPRRVDAAAAPAGTVLAGGAQGLSVATAGGAVRCGRARGDGPKAAAAEVAAALGIVRGSRLGSGQ